MDTEDGQLKGKRIANIQPFFTYLFCINASLQESINRECSAASNILTTNSDDAFIFTFYSFFIHFIHFL